MATYRHLLTRCEVAFEDSQSSKGDDVVRATYHLKNKREVPMLLFCDSECEFEFNAGRDIYGGLNRRGECLARKSRASNLVIVFLQ